jgi:hypothetical protein
MCCSKGSQELNLLNDPHHLPREARCERDHDLDLDGRADRHGTRLRGMYSIF